MTEKKRPHDEALFEVIALLAVAKDCLHKIRNNPTSPGSDTMLRLVTNDIDKCYKVLNGMYEEYLDSPKKNFEQWFWGHTIDRKPPPERSQ